MTVDVGLVEGINPAITPTGTAISVTFLAASSWLTPTVALSFISSYTTFEAKAFLMILSS